MPIAERDIGVISRPEKKTDSPIQIWTTECLDKESILHCKKVEIEGLESCQMVGLQWSTSVQTAGKIPAGANERTDDGLDAPDFLLPQSWYCWKIC